jgi:hypothetical protein
MSKKNPAKDVISPAETMEIYRQQQIGNNPNVYNPYGSSETTFDSNGQPTIRQDFSPETQNLFNMQMDFLNAGAPEYMSKRDPYAQSMMESYGQRAADRGGFDAPQSPIQNVGLNQPPDSPSLGITPPSAEPPTAPPSIGLPPMPNTGRPPTNGGSVGGRPDMPKPIQMPDGITQPTFEPMSNLSYQDPDPDNGVEVGTGRHKFDWSRARDVLAQALKNYGGGR